MANRLLAGCGRGVRFLGHREAGPVRACGRLGGRKDLTRHWPLARLLAAALALLVGVTFAAPPAQAGPATGPISAAAAAQVAAMPNAQAAQAAQPAAPATSQKPFIKTGKGALAFVLLAGALGLTFYSFSNDRVKSPAK
jgi:hypothetical protein